MYKLQLYKMYYKIKKEVVPQYFTTLIPTLTHNYFTRRTTDQRNRIYHAFADHNCLQPMINLLNKSSLIKAQVTTSIIGYEPADLTVHPPPPRTAEGGFIFFRIGVQCSQKIVLKGKPEYFGVN